MTLNETVPGKRTTITIYGASDDLIEVGGCKGADEFSPDGNDAWHADLIAPDGGQMRVFARYERHGCWSVGASQVDEDVPFPAWPVKVRAADPASHETRYCAVLEIDAPDGTRLAGIHPDPQS